MALASAWSEYLANATASIAALQPITLPVTLPAHPLPPLEALIAHLSSTPVHKTYYPLLRFGVIHAARLAIVWAKLTRGRKGSPSVLQDLSGYLCLCWGGGTLVSLLLSDPPSWLSSPTPWLVYVPVYLALVPTGLAEFAYSTLPTLFELAGALADGVTRGAALASIPLLVSKSPLGSTASAASPLGIAWPIGLLGGLMIWGGGLIVQTLGMTQTQWGIGVPVALKGNLLDSMDAWSAALTTLLQYFLLSHPAQSASLPIIGEARQALISWLPAESVVDGKIAPASAKALGVIFLSTLLLTRVIIRLFTLRPAPVVVRKTEVSLFEEPKTSVVKSPVESAATKTTPRKKKAKKEVK